MGNLYLECLKCGNVYCANKSSFNRKATCYFCPKCRSKKSKFHHFINFDKDEMKECKSCGYVNHRTRSYCQSCGKLFE